MLTRFCNGCKQERSLQDFHWKNKERQIRQSQCRFCSAKRSQEHYQNHKREYVLRARKGNKRSLHRNRVRLTEYLSAHPCVDCGCSDIRVLDFDHVRGEKINEVTRLIQENASWRTIEAEIAKCEVRCGNCHRIKTIERGRQWRLQHEPLPLGEFDAEGAALALFGFDPDAASVAFDDVFTDGEAQAQAEFGR